MQLAVSIVWVLLCIVFLGLVYSMYSIRKKSAPIEKSDEEKIETSSEKIGGSESGGSISSLNPLDGAESDLKVSPTMELLIDGKQYRFKAKKIHVVINGENMEIEIADDNAGDVSVPRPKNEVSDVISQSDIDEEDYKSILISASKKAKAEREQLPEEDAGAEQEQTEEAEY